MISSSSTTQVAVRKQGVCRGTLWRREFPKGSMSIVASSGSWSSAEVEYGSVSTNWLSCHESRAAYERGDAPIKLYRVVGASPVDAKTFQVVTNQGTQIRFRSVTQKCRDHWLETLAAGLELTLMELGPSMSISNFSPPSPQVTVKQRRGKKYCISCGAVESSNKPILPTTSAPVVQYGEEGRVDLCQDCFIAQGLLDHLEFVKACMSSSQQEHDVLLQARELCLNLVTPKENAPQTPPLSTETQQQTPSSENTDTSSPPPAEDKHSDKNSDSSQDSWTAVDKPDISADAAATSIVSPTHQSVGSTSWIHISPTSKSTAALIKELGDKPRFGAWTRISPFLAALSDDLLQGRIGVPDFFEQLDDAVGKGDTNSLTALKRQALRAGGDMGTAMKLLFDHALPKHETGDHTNTQTLACLLDFFLDLCEDGEISSVAFFWPQLCHIHLCMLPPENAFAVARVDLMEDFLLTVATEYSVQLALELVWSHTADLEESLGAATCSPPCRNRRFAVLRYVCELESILFGHEDGWGGGSVTLGKMLSATGDQLSLLKRTVTHIQEYRRTALCQLNHSVRRDMLQQRKSQPPERLVEEKLRIAKNADYFTSHLNFTKRLSDIAEKLRFLDIGKRAEALEEELNLLNASGTLGCDPLNRIHDSVIRVVRVPSTEGHVFRSKERTPVLLLIEQIDEGAEAEDPIGETAAAQEKKDVPTEIEDHKDEESRFDENDVEATIRPRADTEPIHLHSTDDALLETPPTPTHRKSLSVSTVDDIEAGSEHRKTSALKRFDTSELSSVEPSTPKEVVEKMVTNVMVEQLKDIQIPLIDPAHSPPKETEKESEENENEEKEEPTATAATPRKEETTEQTAEQNTADETEPPKSSVPRRMFKNSKSEVSDQPNDLAPTGDIRREVLNVIMMRGRRERNTIAAGTADSVQRSLKELERKRATELLLGGEGDQSKPDDDTAFEQLETTTDKLASLGLGIVDPTDVPGEHSEEDEVMEAVRLLLIQNRVAQGQLSAADASKVLHHISLSRANSADKLAKMGDPANPRDMPIVDAGDLDPRLAGCGPLPPAVMQALTLWKGEMVSNGELLELVKKDIAFVRHSVLLEAENIDKLKEDSAFWGRFAFGERWAEKKARIAASSPQGNHPGWDLSGIIVKSNDDLRQEAFVMQLIELCQEAFDIAKLELWVSPYRILATGRTTGTIEMVRNAMSFDALKKRPGYGKGGLREHLLRMTEFTADPGGSFKAAQLNFVRSLAAYSLMSYFFMFKDRHNGNLLLDTAGHVIHIDFGFVFGVAPGGSFSLEMSTPFKLTEEMLEVMGGLRSPIFSEFVTLFCCGFLALQSYSDTFFTLVEVTSRNSTFKCFDGLHPKEREELLTKLQERFCPEMSKEETIAFALDLIKQATTSSGTKQYDMFQYLSQGIAA